MPSDLRPVPNLEDQVTVFISPVIAWPSYTPPTTRRATVEVNPPTQLLQRLLTGKQMASYSTSVGSKRIKIQ
jgi:hypothetical protein